MTYWFGMFFLSAGLGLKSRMCANMARRRYTIESTALADAVTRTDTVVPVPANPSLTGDTYLRAEIRSRHDDFPAWSEPVRVYLRRDGGTFDVVGVER